MTTPNPEDEEDDPNPDATIARLLKKMIRKAERAHLPRYKGRGRVKNRISLYTRANTDQIEFRVSLDIVEKWHGWLMHRMDDPPAPLRPDNIGGLKVRFGKFTRKATPLLIMRLEDFTLKPEGVRLTKQPKGWLFSCTTKAQSIGIDAKGGTLTELDIVHWPAVKGTIIRLPDSHRLYRAKRDDVEPFLNSIDFAEPPRFRGGQMDPDYAAKLAAEAAERTNQE